MEDRYISYEDEIANAGLKFVSGPDFVKDAHRRRDEAARAKIPEAFHAIFTPGTIVHLKSGSPAMTVVRCEDWSGELMVNVTWFTNGQQCIGEFDPRLLTTPHVGKPK